VPAFDVALLPAAFAPWVQDIGERVQCPIDYVAAEVMVNTGAVLGRSSVSAEAAR
jgi:putative DNA primase/helicase